MNQIHSFIAFCNSFFSLLSDYRHNKQLLKNTNDLLLLEVLKTKQDFFQEKEIKRIRFYTSFAPVFAGYTYSTLRGFPITNKEHSLMAKLSILTPVFDDYFDEEGSDVEKLKSMINASTSHISSNAKENFCVSFYKKLQDQVHDKKGLKENIYAVFAAQQEGKTFQASTTKESFKKNTFDKGGYAALLYRNMLDHPIKKGEQEAIRSLGGMIQWLDDIFDIYEDNQAGIYTIPNTATDAYLLAKDYEEGLKEMIVLFKNLGYKKKDTDLFLNKLMIVFVRGLVCLEKLKITQDKYGEGFRPFDYERKDLICDMEKVSNLYKLYRYFSVYHKQMRNGADLQY